MHYKNGREAKVGDKILVPNVYSGPYIGVVVDATPGAESCNLKVVPLPTLNSQCETAAACLHVEDALVKPDAQG